jgi:DNA repair protein RecO (recombination protein O)
MPEVYPRAPRGSFSRRLTLTAHRDAMGTQEPLRQSCRTARPGLCPMTRALVHYHLGTTQLRTRQVGLELQRLADPPSR